MAPKKLWRKILTRKTKEDNKIALKDWNSYLKTLYESLDMRDNIQTLLTMKEVFSLEDIDLGLSAWQMENPKTLKATKWKS